MEKKNKLNKRNNNPGKEKMSKKTSNLLIDDRFQAMFTDKNFKLKYVTDKRGRPIDRTSSKDLKEFYSIATSESESEDDSEKLAQDSQNEMEVKIKKSQKLNEKGHKTQDIASAGELEKQDTSESEARDSEGVSKVKSNDVESDESSETSSDTSEDIEDDLDEEFDHKWEELDANAPVASTATKRLALCNMDWDRIRAEDILAVFNSFKPSSGIIHSVKVYPSEYGARRIEEERLNGPAELVEQTLESDEENVKEDKEGSKYHREKLRQYQLNRLKYYYAVIECDSAETADSLYEQLNGMEYESSAVSMDLRFIPDDLTFDQPDASAAAGVLPAPLVAINMESSDEEPKSSASSAPDPTEYKPTLFTNSALQQVKVSLTWDETDPKRRETLRKAFKEPDSIEKDIKDYLASSSGSSEDEGVTENTDNNQNRQLKMKDRISKYKALLQSIEDKEKEQKNKFEMEITWEPGLKEKTEEVVKEKIEKETLTPFEKKLKKQKEETKQRKKERKLFLTKKGNATDSEDDDNLESNEDDDQPSDMDFNTSHFNQSAEKDKSKMVDELSLLVSESTEETLARTKRQKRKEKKKLKEKKAENFEMDVSDDRFSAIYTSHHYNIDPSDPHFKDSKGMQKIMQEKLKKRKSDFTDPKPVKKHRTPTVHDDSNIEDSIILI